MTNRIKNGQELLEVFFSRIPELQDVDECTAEVIKRLYFDGKLTPTNIANELELIREGSKEIEIESN